MDNDSINEIEILKRVKAGNLGAFETILFKYQKGIFNYVYRLINHRQDAEDLTAEILIKLYKSRKLIEPEKNFKAWLYKIATNTTYDWFRKKKREKELFILDDPNYRIETTDKESTYYNIGVQQDLNQALEKISPAYRTVLLLFYYQNLTYQEISIILSISLNNVKSHLHRAKKALKEKLDYDSN